MIVLFVIGLGITVFGVGVLDIWMMLRKDKAEKPVEPAPPADNSVEEKIILAQWINSGGSAFFLHPEGPLSDKTVDDWCKEQIAREIHAPVSPYANAFSRRRLSANVQAIHDAARQRGALH